MARAPPLFQSFFFSPQKHPAPRARPLHTRPRAPRAPAAHKTPCPARACCSDPPRLPRACLLGARGRQACPATCQCIRSLCCSRCLCSRCSHQSAARCGPSWRRQRRRRWWRWPGQQWPPPPWQHHGRSADCRWARLSKRCGGPFPGPPAPEAGGPPLPAPRALPHLRSRRSRRSRRARIRSTLPHLCFCRCRRCPRHARLRLCL
jgi:hypothetical protein